jgi:hypothetical protein
MAGTIYGECEDFVNESQGFGITTVNPNASGGLDITTQPPVFTTVSGSVEITGDWPNLLINDAGANVPTTYSFNSGAGIEVTGGPTDFTFSLKPTGIIAGDYGPVNFNQFGQATVVGQILSSVTGVNGVSATVDAATGAVELVMRDATVSNTGVVALYDTVGSLPYPSDVAATPSAVLQIVDLEIAALSSAAAGIQLFQTPAPPTIDGPSLANSALLATTQIISVPANAVVGISINAKLTAPLNCAIALIATGVNTQFVAISPVENSDEFTFFGSITGPFANTIELRAYVPGAAAPVSAILANASMMVK